ncbi:MAG: hypothetical protein HYY06_13500 [Deltaproteobacteria bacterium]|nr:hypothetical protein [Deltaproteobacteria bacterium]
MDVFRELYGRFDPEGAPANPSWRAQRSRSPADEISRRLERDIGDGRFLLVGTVGAGKSTELSRIAESRAAGSFVVQLDLVQHFDKIVGDLDSLRHVQSWEVVFLAALAVSRAAKERFDFDFIDGALADLAVAWKRAADKSAVPDSERTEVDLVRLMKAMVILASAAAGGAPAAGAASYVLAPLDAVEAKWKLPIGRSSRALDDQTDEAQTLLHAANVIIGNVQHRLGRRVLLVLDGLDRVEDREAAAALFVNSAILGRLSCHAVVCAPFVLRHDPTLALVRGFEVKVLVSEPVLDKDRPRDLRGPGIDFMVELFQRRTADLGVEIDPGILSELAHRSGGRLRDFVKLVREVAGQVLLSGSPGVTRGHADAAMREQRLLLETGLTRQHIDVLREVMNDPARRPPAGQLGYELLRTSRLLPYLDGSEWFYPHALLLSGQLLE